MPRELCVSDITFQRAHGAAYRGGVEGWVRCTIDSWLRLDGLVIRRTATGDVSVFFPEHIDAAARRHALIWPVRAEDRAELQRVILLEIRGRLESAP